MMFTANNNIKVMVAAIYYLLPSTSIYNSIVNEC